MDCQINLEPHKSEYISQSPCQVAKTEGLCSKCFSESQSGAQLVQNIFGPSKINVTINCHIGKKVEQINEKPREKQNSTHQRRDIQTES